MVGIDCVGDAGGEFGGFLPVASVAGSDGYFFVSLVQRRGTLQRAPTKSHLPLNFASRFSKNAVIPSFLSSVAKVSANASFS